MSEKARVDYRDVLAALGAMMAEAGDEGVVAEPYVTLDGSEVFLSANGRFCDRDHGRHLCFSFLCEKHKTGPIRFSLPT